MSVHVSDLVWRCSKHSGTELLMLLALADWSDDKGYSFPSIAVLATKCRMSPRNAGYLLKALLDSGELEVKMNAGFKGPHGSTNLYRIAVKKLEAAQSDARVQPAAGVQHAAGVQPAAGVQSSVARGEAGFQEGVKPTAPNTSLIRQEPSDTSSKPTKRLPPCPYDQIRAIYNASLPNDHAPLPPKRAKVCDTSRKNLMLATWNFVLTEPKEDGSPRAENAADALDWFRRYFAKCWESDHLAGRSARGAGHEAWRCDLDHVLSPKCRTRVIEE